MAVIINGVVISGDSVVINGHQISGNTGTYIKGSGIPKEVQHNLPFFKGIEVSVGALYVVSEKPEPQREFGILRHFYRSAPEKLPEHVLTIKADDNLLEYITFEVQNEILYLGMKDISYMSTIPISLELKTHSLRSIRKSGQGSVCVRGDLGPDFYFRGRGQGSSEIAGNADCLTCEFSGQGSNTILGDFQFLKIQKRGQGSLVASGSTDEAEIRISGQGFSDLSGMISREVDVDISGQGSIRLHGKEIIGSASGQGTISVNRDSNCQLRTKRRLIRR